LRTYFLKSFSEMNALSVRESYEQIIQRFCEWAENRADIRASFVLGSRARVDHPADDWADLDLVIVTTDPKYYVTTGDWINVFGRPLLTFVEPTTIAEEKERRVLFEGMLDVDFAILPQQKALAFLQAAKNPEGFIQLSNVFGRGIRILVDKDQIVTKLQTMMVSMEKPVSERPTQQRFLDAVNDFLYHAVFTAKHLRRGELWWTIMCLDCGLQDRMKTMIESHALAMHEWKRDVWFRGRFLEEWAGSEVTNELRKGFAHYDREDAKQALMASISLFSRIAYETAQRLNYPYPRETDKRITEWIEKCLAEDTHLL
jgi:aminoglycoside 6-adenylyltransferase